MRLRYQWPYKRQWLKEGTIKNIDKILHSAKMYLRKRQNIVNILQLFSTTSHHGQIDLNKILGTAKGTHQTSKWTPLESQIIEN